MKQPRRPLDLLARYSAEQLRAELARRASKPTHRKPRRKPKP